MKRELKKYMKMCKCHKTVFIHIIFQQLLQLKEFSSEELFWAYIEAQAYSFH